ncbi:MAG: acyltransferase [candidate division KSB1 bacterium]|nr:acyltransferase [candidate division KSB1 bacterium]MDZ7295443.1 acyltransferase [candidate division KSB1 bacterium]MDZ7384758.1 acyltransferase [candidate division KSB1 bacterium]MDZ7391277.1 acyltransferase [candidate division KSB1 bacterium]MDZ7412002.1 acyltransferase [candidate division KSB1 bacterium]
MPKQKLHRAITDESQSALRRYQMLALGSTRFLDLLKYELIITLTSWVPGAFGYWLRKKCYPMLLGSCGRNPIFGQHVTIRHGSKIHLGDNVVVDDFVVLDAKGEGNAGITIGDNVILGRYSVLSCKDGTIRVGNNVSLGVACVIHSVGASSVVIGNDCPIAAYCYLIGGGNYRYDRVDIPIMQQEAYSKGGIVVEDNVWIGAQAVVLDGVTIGSGSVVAAGAAVYRNVPKMSIVGGVPAKVVRRRA